MQTDSPMPQPAAQLMLCDNDSLFFSSEYYQVLIAATHLRTPEGWKAELARV